MRALTLRNAVTSIEACMIACASANVNIFVGGGEGLVTFGGTEKNPGTCKETFSVRWFYDGA